MIEYGHIIRGMVMIFGGVYSYLLAIGALPKNPKDPEKMDLWRKKFGKFMKIAGPLMVIFGILALFKVI